MKAAYLIDTNVLVYAYDPTDDAKRQRAVEVLTHLASTGTGALSAQVLGEFYVVVTRRIPSPLTPQEATRSITNYLRSWPVYDISGWAVREAAQGSQRYQMNYWDALIWATAKLRQVPTVLSEDFADGLMIEGIRFVNPFTPAFRLTP